MQAPATPAYRYVPHSSAVTAAPALPSPESTVTPAVAPAPPAAPSTRPATPPSPPKPLPPSALTSLRRLDSRLKQLLSSSSSTSRLELQVLLEKLLIEADGLESGGDDLVRRERRDFVRQVEKELEKLEGPTTPLDSVSVDQPTAAPAPETESSPASSSTLR